MRMSTPAPALSKMSARVEALVGKEYVRHTEFDNGKDTGRAGCAFGLQSHQAEAEFIGIEPDRSAHVGNKELGRNGHYLAWIERHLTSLRHRRSPSAAHVRP